MLHPALLNLPFPNVLLSSYLNLHILVPDSPPATATCTGRRWCARSTWRGQGQGNESSHVSFISWFQAGRAEGPQVQPHCWSCWPGSWRVKEQENKRNGNGASQQICVARNLSKPISIDVFHQGIVIWVITQKNQFLHEEAGVLASMSLSQNSFWGCSLAEESDTFPSFPWGLKHCGSVRRDTHRTLPTRDRHPQGKRQWEQQQPLLTRD